MKIVELHQVTKKFPHFTMGPIQMKISSGYIHAVVGANSSGKSTLLRTIMGLHKPDSGKIILFSEPYHPDAIHLQQRIAYVPDSFLGPKHWYTRQIETFYQRWYPNWDHSFYQEILQRFSIQPSGRYETLSKGTRRKLLFSLAMACQTDLCILDEATVGFDLHSKQVFRETINRWMEQGERSVLFTSHDFEEIEKLADYITILDDGKDLGTFEKDQLTEIYKVIWFKESNRERLIQIPIPSEVIEVIEEPPYRWITKNLDATKFYLEQHQMEIGKIQALPLQELIPILIRHTTKQIQKSI